MWDEMTGLEVDRETAKGLTAAAISSWGQPSAKDLAAEAFKNGPPANGVAVFNPCSFPRRACFFVPPKITPKVGIPGPRSSATRRSIRRHRRRSRLGMELDVAGGETGFRPRTRQADRVRIETQEQIHRSRDRQGFRRTARDLGRPHRIQPARTADRSCDPAARWSARSRTITANGPAFGEITTEGDLLAPDGKEKWATFKQTFRLWIGRPVLEIDVHLEPQKPLEANVEDYFGLRWAWPDEKAIVSTTDGLVLHSHRGGAIESPILVDIRERNLLTTIVPMGLPFHRRSAPQDDGHGVDRRRRNRT